MSHCRKDVHDGLKHNIMNVRYTDALPFDFVGVTDGVGRPYAGLINVPFLLSFVCIISRFIIQLLVLATCNLML